VKKIDTLQKQLRLYQGNDTVARAGKSHPPVSELQID
jgi:hypothetical protein